MRTVWPTRLPPPPSSLSGRHFTQSERLALAGYRGLIREACTLELCRLFCAPSRSERGDG